MNKDRAGSFIFLLVGILGFIFSIKLPMGKLTEPGPGVFPLLLSTLLSILGVLIFLFAKAKKTMDERTDSRQLTKPLFIVLFTAAFILALGRLGYLVSSALYLWGLFFLVCRFRLGTAAALAGALSAVSWYFFGNILGVHLPRGPWGP